jgi:hypothetical protein
MTWWKKALMGAGCGVTVFLVDLVLDWEPLGWWGTGILEYRVWVAAASLVVVGVIVLIDKLRTLRLYERAGAVESSLTPPPSVRMPKSWFVVAPLWAVLGGEGVASFVVMLWGALLFYDLIAALAGWDSVRSAVWDVQGRIRPALARR